MFFGAVAELKAITPKWCAWKTFGQLASIFSILMDVDWNTLFKSFYAEVKLLIACKDYSKIPPQRIVEMNQELYLLNLKVDPIASGGSDGLDPRPEDGNVTSRSDPQSSIQNMETDNLNCGLSEAPQ